MTTAMRSVDARVGGGRKCTLIWWALLRLSRAPDGHSEKRGEEGHTPRVDQFAGLRDDRLDVVDVRVMIMAGEASQPAAELVKAAFGRAGQDEDPIIPQQRHELADKAFDVVIMFEG